MAAFAMSFVIWNQVTVLELNYGTTTEAIFSSKFY